MWVHEIYGLPVTEDQLERALGEVWEHVRGARPSLSTQGEVRTVFHDAVVADRRSERHGDVHTDGPPPVDETVSFEIGALDGESFAEFVETGRKKLRLL